eukprot:TRINITY_DN4439_c0_g1_i1.p1 TRINITY_DN4439_c0_g1~~TRINITY_DN4439_c0_g1_i1.p1  ORF type:complete len:520 (+),score=97.52 TRINITY_DN4439_c0_g1_i1:169-1728(+)
MGSSLSCLSCHQGEGDENKSSEGGGERQTPVETSPLEILSVQNLILETLGVYRSIVESNEEPPLPMLKLHSLAYSEEGWLRMVECLIEVIPLREPVGPASMTLLLDECPLPSASTVSSLIRQLGLNTTTPDKATRPGRHRNIAIILGCIADKLAGPRSVDVFSSTVQDYLLSNLNESHHPSLILFSIIALEKFCQTTENKELLLRILSGAHRNPFLTLEGWAGRKDALERQVGVCSQWLLDNTLLVEDRPFSYTHTNMDGVNVILNSNDVSEYLKITPDGLEARCDAFSFESVRCTFQVDEGVWFYEVILITDGIMQIGWATKDSKFLNYDGYGIGDDVYSIAYDGCRQLFWYNAQIYEMNVPCWKPGDVLGSLLDYEKKQITFYVNGVELKPFEIIFEEVSSGFFAAASFMSFQQCRFNFGASPYVYPPKDRNFNSFNDFGSLSPEEKVILPRHIKLRKLEEQSVTEDACTLCFDDKASVTLQPCGHRGFCMKCTNQLTSCPMCRLGIESINHEPSQL